MPKIGQILAYYEKFRDQNYVSNVCCPWTFAARVKNLVASSKTIILIGKIFTYFVTVNVTNVLHRIDNYFS